MLVDKINKALQLKEQVLPIQEVEEEIELPELTQTQLKRIEKALRGDPNEVLAQKFSLNITRRDMLTLAGKKKYYHCLIDVDVAVTWWKFKVYIQGAAP